MEEQNKKQVSSGLVVFLTILGISLFAATVYGVFQLYEIHYNNGVEFGSNKTYHEIYNITFNTGFVNGTNMMADIIINMSLNCEPIEIPYNDEIYNLILYECLEDI